MPKTEQLHYQTVKSSRLRFSIKIVLKKFAVFSGNYLFEIFKNTYFEEHLCTAASALTLQRDCLEFCFWIRFKAILTQ